MLLMHSKSPALPSTCERITFCALPSIDTLVIVVLPRSTRQPASSNREAANIRAVRMASPCGVAVGSHVAEQRHVRLADRQRFGPLLEVDRAAAAVVAADRGDCLEVDDGRAVHLLEHRRVEQAEQLADR